MPPPPRRQNRPRSRSRRRPRHGADREGRHAMKMILVGDVNLMNVEDAGVPFAMLGAEMRAADLVFPNLECLLYRPPEGHAVEHEGFLADPAIGGEALQTAGIGAVGLANNVNYGAAAILGSIWRLGPLRVTPRGGRAPPRPGRG